MVQAADTNVAVRSQMRSNDEWISAINELLGSQRTPVFGIGDLLIDAEGTISKKALGTVIKASGLKSKQNANNYMRVARAPLLRKPDYFDHLPITVGALIDLAAWSERELSEGIRAGVIHSQSERIKLQKWRRTFNFGSHREEEIPPTAHVVAYIMCDATTYSFDRAYDLWGRFDEIKLKCLPDDMHITPYEADVQSLHRMEQLWRRIWDAYVSNPELFVNPRFKRMLDDRHIDNGDTCLYVKDIAPIIASGDHKELHKIIKFSRWDWKFLGVSEVGHATLLEYFSPDDKSAASDGL